MSGELGLAIGTIVFVVVTIGIIWWKDRKNKECEQECEWLLMMANNLPEHQSEECINCHKVRKDPCRIT